MTDEKVRVRVWSALSLQMLACWLVLPVAYWAPRQTKKTCHETGEAGRTHGAGGGIMTGGERTTEEDERGEERRATGDVRLIADGSLVLATSLTQPSIRYGGRAVFVGNLPEFTRERDLEDLFYKVRVFLVWGHACMHMKSSTALLEHPVAHC